MDTYLPPEFPGELHPSPEHGLARNQVSNDAHVRCPLGCVQVHQKDDDGRKELLTHLKRVHSADVPKGHRQALVRAVKG